MINRDPEKKRDKTTRHIKRISNREEEESDEKGHVEENENDGQSHWY